MARKKHQRCVLKDGAFITKYRTKPEMPFERARREFLLRYGADVADVLAERTEYPTRETSR